MPPLPSWVWKALPWAVAIAVVLTGVKMYGDRRAAEGAVKAYVATADQLQKQLSADSVAAAKARRQAADSLARLNQALAEAGRRAAAAQQRADRTVQQLRPTLDTVQAQQLDQLVAAHEAERAEWGRREAVYLARLQLMAADSSRQAAEIASLRRINASLRAATEGAVVGGGPSFVQRVAPYVAVGLAAVQVVDFATRK
jgi:hypothetical protein